MARWESCCWFWDYPSLFHSISIHLVGEGGCWRVIALEESGEVNGNPGKSSGKYDWKNLFLKIGCIYWDRVPWWMVWQKAQCGGDACSAVTDPFVVTGEAEDSERRVVHWELFLWICLLLTGIIEGIETGTSSGPLVFFEAQCYVEDIERCHRWGISWGD